MNIHGRDTKDMLPYSMTVDRDRTPSVLMSATFTNISRIMSCGMTCAIDVISVNDQLV